MNVDETMLHVAWERSVGASRPAAVLFDSLVARHREPHRRYHGLRHLAWVVRHVHELTEHEEVRDAAAVVVAAFFHDAVYSPTASDNEAASARLAGRELTALADPGWPADRIERVAALVLATATHLAPAENNDADATSTQPAGAQPAGADAVDLDTAVLLDADLAVLGAEPSTYQSYVDGVRAEYAHVDAAAWRRGRGEVVRALADRPRLYRTQSGRMWWEARARANLAAELAALG